jgi:superfamily II DNA or RNA helicase
MIDLRPYQIEAIRALRNAMKTGHTKVVLCAPTGAG